MKSSKNKKDKESRYEKSLLKSITALLVAGAVLPLVVSCGKKENPEEANVENPENVVEEEDNSEPDDQPAVYEGYTLVWEEQFDGDS